jgi:uncharacterized RDD family membrane protein YckC
MTLEATPEESAPAIVEETVETTAPTAKARPSSTLIEFPGAGRARPQWRKDLSERVREIQERRAREGSREAEEKARQRAEQPAKEAGASPLGLVPQPDQPKINPIVAAALKRLERAQQPTPPPRRQAMGGAAVAVARVAEEQYQLESQVEERPALAPVPESIREPEQALETKPAEAAREHTLSVVQPTLVAQSAPVISQAPATHAVVVPPASEPTLETQDADAFAFEEIYDDRASVFSRIAASFVDLLVVAFASSPFAAIIELTNGNWTDERVVASMGGILAIIMFLYLTTSTALAGRTWGMSLVSLRAVDVDTGLPPTTRQSVTRAVAYMLSLVTLGFGLLYALFDAEGRTAHDHLSGTAVVRD